MYACLKDAECAGCCSMFIQRVGFLCVFSGLVLAPYFECFLVLRMRSVFRLAGRSFYFFVVVVLSASYFECTLVLKMLTAECVSSGWHVIQRMDRFLLFVISLGLFLPHILSVRLF